MLKVVRIQEDDYGCEERPDDWEPQVLVTLQDERGQKQWKRVIDRQLLERGIEVGSLWPEDWI